LHDELLSADPAAPDDAPVRALAAVALNLAVVHDPG
jgi:hypothetical protein